MEPYATEKQVRLITRQARANFTPSLDGRAIQQALINLLDNAVKHSPPGATVEIGTEPGPARKTVLLYIQDAGPGIPPGEEEKIFQRFYRLGSELRRETEGIGIGLSIVQHIVQAHGGKVRVESSQGCGSRFIMELPMEWKKHPEHDNV